LSVVLHECANEIVWHLLVAPQRRASRQLRVLAA